MVGKVITSSARMRRCLSLLDLISIITGFFPHPPSPTGAPGSDNVNASTLCSVICLRRFVFWDPDVPLTVFRCKRCLIL